MSRTAWIVIAAGSLTSIAATPALATERGFYLSGGAGHAEENPGKSIGTNIAIGFPPTGIQHIDPDRVETSSSGVAWDATVGYKINSHVAAEVAYMDFGTTTISEHYQIDVPLIPGVPVLPVLPIELTHKYSSKVTGPTFSVLGSLPLGKGFDVFVRGGVLFADRKIDIPLSTGINGTKFGSTVWLGGAGVDWSLASRWVVRAEYQRTGKLDAAFLAGSSELERASVSVVFAL